MPIAREARANVRNTWPIPTKLIEREIWSELDADEGYVYILGVADIDLPVSKIGRTAGDPFARCAEINRSSTGEFIWEVTHQLAVNDCRKFESLVHAKLFPFRQRRREFFNLHPDDAIVAVQSILTSSADLKEITIARSERVSAVSKGKVGVRKKLEGSSRNSESVTDAKVCNGISRCFRMKGELV
ncbi:GIY-YIG nuclease family protein [Caballeronia sp. LZ043]|uniref:GIY-YIG nuclease family protein n=1 Tax=Caballeronia sp. LZ043 TaxID=3038569 RepID=UPI0038576004